MTRAFLITIALAAATTFAAAQTPQAPSLPLGAGEPPHTHATDVILVPVLSGLVDVSIGDKTFTSLKAGEVQFVPHDVVHHVKNTGTQRFEPIAISLK